MRLCGVNLGNWLVLERWMDPGMFAGTNAADETWLNRLLPRAEVQRRLKFHRETYVTYADFQWLAARGVTFVRLPVPYFVFGDMPPYESCIEYVDRAMDWAEKTGIRILLDLHTTPGCQNGYDNGGLVGVCRWHRDASAVTDALSVLERLAKRYGNRKGLFGIEPVNEPISFLVYHTAPTTGKARDPAEAAGSGYVPMHFLKMFYKEAYRRMRAYLPKDKAIVFHDGFRLTAWRDFFARNGMENVYLDAHIYLWAMEKFVPFHCFPVYQLYLAWERKKIRLARRYTPVIVGEWTICCRWAADLSRHRVIRKWENAGIPTEERLREQTRRFRKVLHLEVNTWKSADGWCYWNYELLRDPKEMMNRYWKDSWDIRRCFRNGWIPNDLFQERKRARTCDRAKK